jgi:hypothetical protein
MLDNPDENTLRDIGLLYLACAHAIDKDLTEAERDLIVHKMEGRLVAATEHRVFKAVLAAVGAYRTHEKAGTLSSRVHEIAVALAGLMDPTDLRTLLDDLVEMARSDGVLCQPEQAFLDDVSRTFGIPLDS